MKKLMRIVSLVLVFTMCTALCTTAYAATKKMLCESRSHGFETSHELKWFTRETWTEPCPVTSGCTVTYREMLQQWQCTFNDCGYRTSYPEDRDTTESHNRNSCPLRSLRMQEARRLLGEETYGKLYLTK